MKLYRYTSGDIEAFAPADDEKDAYERREEVNPAFHYLPVTVEEFRVDGYEITVKSLDETAPRRGRRPQA